LLLGRDTPKPPPLRKAKTTIVFVVRDLTRHFFSCLSLSFEQNRISPRQGKSQPVFVLLGRRHFIPRQRFGGSSSSIARNSTLGPGPRMLPPRQAH
jgi:hypothetical protein